MPKPRKTRKTEEPELDATGMSPLAQVHLAKFKKWLKEDMAEVETIPLIVLVWGPGESGGDLYQKTQAATVLSRTAMLSVSRIARGRFFKLAS